ncbi:MerR family DNA-binding transcriptional regulator [Streptomyces sp. NPDC101227]|uniref:MerR family DNA-binding transcriptional regulator n=1 Tax=Streptomyces sp. NPDC101227 TaxID=3366136 RepID=UPI003824AADE
MRLAELSERSGVSTATIKYYLREGLLQPAHRRLVESVAALARLGYPCDTEQLLPYGRLAAQLAVTDLDMVEEQPTPTGQIEAAVALTVLYEPVLLSLRRMAHAEESARRF